jgi:hypothetical protein
MALIEGTVTETLVVEKTVELTVPDEFDEEEIIDCIREAAHKDTVLDYEDKHGWAGIACLDVDIVYTVINDTANAIN